ncbi:PREDICTED: uncharacterized protein LOC107347690 [Acropora digitifera]|uniref:uncharacterized protein LOC107347690 n=1 Tax=Acropora digitifera TaxID=70779 RepID=UPI00077ADD17|nr:PREDICTED: uncharacterized protein LOC107347690 [Acropora digitifera]
MKSQGVSLYIAGGMLVARVTSSKQFWQVQTSVGIDFWCYILITWHPNSGLQLYGNGNLKATLTASQSNPTAAPVYAAKPNVAIGRALGQATNQLCGLVYVSSIAIFKQFVTQQMASSIFGFFWKNIVSKQPLKDYFIKMKITNLSGKKILLVPGDNDPASGMPINANVIAMVTKDVPVVEPNAPALQFAVVDAETRKQFLLINGSQLITLRPVPNKNVMPINLLIGKPISNQIYYLVLRIVNMAGDDIALKTSDGDPKDGFVIRKKTIAVITKKVKSPLPVLFSASPKADETKTFFINYKPKLELKPIVTRDANAPVTLTLTKNAAPVTLYYISLRLANFGTQDVKITTSDSNPVQGFTVRARTIALITKNVTHRNPLTFWAKAADHSCVLNNQPSLVVIPEEKTGAWKVVNITDKYVPPANPPSSQRFSLLLQITNNAGVKITLMSSDAKPVSGEALDAGSMMTIAKVTQHMRSIKFLAVESATERRLLINGMDSVSVSPSKKQIVTPLIISGAYSGTAANRLPEFQVLFFIYEELKQDAKISPKCWD